MAIAKEVRRLVYESNISGIESVNSSFDTGILRVAYTGKNRNGSYISKETFEASVPSLYNCPIVCNYDRETDSIGSHDMEVVKDDKGMRLVYVTQPVGVVPESGKWWWEDYTEDDGTVHEYLCCDVLLWKRQEAYAKIKSNGITDESMEITIKSGHSEDGIYYIDSFEFTALCLLESAEPCYESAGLEVFSVDFEAQYAQMINELKQEYSTAFTKVDTPMAEAEEININPQTNTLKGGEPSLNDEMKQEMELEASAAEPTPDNSEAQEEEYSLTARQLRDEFSREFEKMTVKDPWGDEVPEYFYQDHDVELGEVYAIAIHDWAYYGFNYSMDGDHVVIDFDSKKKKKITYVDFEEGSTEVEAPEVNVFEFLAEHFAQHEKTAIENQKAESDAKFSEMQAEITELTEFKNQKLGEERDEAVNNIFAQFEELAGNEAFDALVSEHSEMSLEDIEAKCFEIKGRTSKANFSIDKNKVPKLPIEKTKIEEEPYGDLFIKYGTANK